MLLLASAPRSPFLRNDLGSSGKLQFRVHARELGAQAVQLLDVDLAPLVHLPARHPAGAAGPLSNGHQTMVVAGVYTVSSACVHAGCQRGALKVRLPYSKLVGSRVSTTTRHDVRLLPLKVPGPDVRWNSHYCHLHT